MHSANLFHFIYIYFISVWSYWNKLYFPKTKEQKKERKRNKKNKKNKKEPNYIWDRSGVATAHMHLPFIHNAELNRPKCDNVTGNSILW